MNNPTLEIISEGEADIVKGGDRWKLKGGQAAAIIATYRHMQTHSGAWSAVYLMGVIDGLHHAALIYAEETIERLGRSRKP